MLRLELAPNFNCKSCRKHAVSLFGALQKDSHLWISSQLHSAEIDVKPFATKTILIYFHTTSGDPSGAVSEILVL